MSEPIFAEPWQARVLALADALVRGGVFSATEWSEALGRHVRRSETAASEAYYDAALAALEELAALRAAISDDLLDARIAAERRAAAAAHSRS